MVIILYLNMCFSRVIFLTLIIMEKAKAHILSHFKQIQGEAYERITNLEYDPTYAWGADGSKTYKMPNNEFFRYWVKGWNNSETWLSHLLTMGENGEMNNTDSVAVRVLREAGQMMNKTLILAGYALLKPGGKIDVHQDETESRGWKNVWHLGIFVADECHLVVSEGGDKPTLYTEDIGKIIAFDDSNFHGAINNGSKDRVILYIKWI